MGRAVLVAAAFLACVLTGCTRQVELVPANSRPDGYREAGGASLYIEPETKSVLNNSSNGIGLRLFTSGSHAGDYEKVSWIAAIYNSNGELESRVVDPIKGIDFSYPYVHVHGQDNAEDIPYIYGYLDESYTVFILMNIPGERSDLERIANRMFPHDQSTN